MSNRPAVALCPGLPTALTTETGQSPGVALEKVALELYEPGDRLELPNRELPVGTRRIFDQRAIDGCTDPCDLVGHFHDHAAAVLRIADAPDEPGRLEPIEHARHSPSRETNGVGQLASGEWTTRAQDVEDSPVRSVYTGELDHQRVEELLVGLPAADLVVQRSEYLGLRS